MHLYACTLRISLSGRSLLHHLAALATRADVNRGQSSAWARDLQRTFLSKHPELDEVDVPVVLLDTSEWSNPLAPALDLT